MRFDGLDLNLIVALDALLELRSVSASAERLHLSQPALTGALNRLRQYFGDELLVLRNRRMFLTARAEELRLPIARALTQIRSEITQPGTFDPATSTRRFVIVASDYAFTVLVADLIAAASQQAPHISFEIVAPDNRANERFERAETDIHVVVEQFALPDYPREELWRDEEVVVSWAGAGYDWIDEAVFFGARHAVAFFGADRQPSVTEVLLNDQKLHRTIDLLLPSFTAIPQAIVGTRRLASMHRRFAQHFARLYPIILHPYPIAIPAIVEVVQWHQVRRKDQGGLWLLALLRQCSASLLTGAPSV